MAAMAAMAPILDPDPSYCWVPTEIQRCSDLVEPVATIWWGNGWKSMETDGMIWIDMVSGCIWLVVTGTMEF